MTPNEIPRPTDRIVGFKAHLDIQVTDKMVRQFAEMSGDFNPIHVDEEYAKSTRFGRRIAHGMIVGALISRTLNEKIGGGGVYLAQNLKFVNPVFIDDTVTIELTITGLRKEKGIATVETLAKKQTGEIVVKGEAIIMMSVNA
ncbi:MAG: MaoC family dehydratase [Bdellovibrionaceae bacterium]|nr:MaoC family dehydratase [Pseudobdellovibrionaceae bacterium]